MLKILVDLKPYNKKDIKIHNVRVETKQYSTNITELVTGHDKEKYNFQGDIIIPASPIHDRSEFSVHIPKGMIEKAYLEETDKKSETIMIDYIESAISKLEMFATIALGLVIMDLIVFHVATLTGKELEYNWFIKFAEHVYLVLYAVLKTLMPPEGPILRKFISRITGFIDIKEDSRIWRGWRGM